jgi:hypothetical protein
MSRVTLWLTWIVARFYLSRAGEGSLATVVPDVAFYTRTQCY